MFLSKNKTKKNHISSFPFRWCLRVRVKTEKNNFSKHKSLGVASRSLFKYESMNLTFLCSLLLYNNKIKALFPNKKIPGFQLT